jgi:hypothetical protein
MKYKGFESEICSEMNEMKVLKYIQGKENCAVGLYNLLAELQSSWREKLPVKIQFMTEISATK